MSGNAVELDVSRPAPPAALDDDAVAGLRAALLAADYTVERVEAALGTHAVSARRADTAVHTRRLEGGDAFSCLARLFLLGRPVSLREVRAALRRFPVEALEELGLAHVDGASVHAAARLVPHGEYYIASDRDADGGRTPIDFVAGIQAPSVMLAKLAVRRAARSALDLGTGCGIQALLAAKHCDRVVATDVNERALAFAAFNARLNGVAGIELRKGDGFDPVPDERFDLVVANPPYVVSPGVEYLYRDNPLAGDELCRRLVQTAPAFLTEGGFAHLLVSWAQRSDDWAAALRAWVAGSGCDAWLLHYKTEDPLTHAANWLGPLADDDVEGFERELDRWLAYLRDLEIGAVGYGAVVLRRRSTGPDWVRADALPLDRLEPASDHTLRVFEAQDYLAGIGRDDEVLEARLALVDGHLLEQRLRCGGGFVVESQTLSLDEGLAFRVGIDRYTTALLPHLDGTRPVREAVAAAARSVPLDESEHARFADAAVPVVRRLLELGFLRPA